MESASSSKLHYLLFLHSLGLNSNFITSFTLWLINHYSSWHVRSREAYCYVTRLLTRQSAEKRTGHFLFLGTIIGPIEWADGLLDYRNGKSEAGLLGVQSTCTRNGLRANRGYQGIDLWSSRLSNTCEILAVRLRFSSINFSTFMEVPGEMWHTIS